MSLQEKNQAEKNNYNSSCGNSVSSEAKPHVMGRRPVKKLIKPIQHLRPLEEPLILHTSSSPQPPPKRPNLGNTSPVHNTELPEQHNVDTKEEPLEVSDDQLTDARYEDHTESKAVLNTRLPEPSSSQLSINWPGDYKSSMDTCSPGKQ